jgi:UDP-2,3-diacylglucosamine pyrophosphatase LpxH
MEEFARLYVVSDLHLGGAPGFQIFDQGALLAATIRSLAAKDGPTALVLNGDIVDFLATPEARYFDPAGAPSRLDAIAADPAFREVFDALGEFLAAPRCTLVLGLGNHDVELALPHVQARLLDRITGGDAAKRGRVQVAMDGTGWSCTVGGRRALCVHGNEVDEWNVVEEDDVLRQVRALREGAEPPPWSPNAGTRLVIDLMNQVKARYPLVDLLKPERVPVVAVLLALDPTQVVAARNVAALVARYSKDKARMATGFLEAEPAGDAALASLLDGATPANVARPADDWLTRVQTDLASAPLESVMGPEGDDERYLGWGGLFLDKLRRRDPSENLRQALQSYLADDRTHEIDHEDTTFKRLDARVAPSVDFLIAGHTHLARALGRRNGPGFYFNSGTWARLIRLTPSLLESPAAFEPVVRAFSAGTLAALDDTAGLVRRVPTVVGVERTGDRVVAALHVATPTAGGALLDPLRESRFEVEVAR